MSSRVRSAGHPPSPRPAAHRHRAPWAGDFGELTDDAELVVSELLMNALKASQSLQEIRPLALCPLSDHKRLFMEVWDRSPREPRPAPADGKDEAGRGYWLSRPSPHGGDTREPAPPRCAPGVGGQPGRGGVAGAWGVRTNGGGWRGRRAWP